MPIKFLLLGGGGFVGFLEGGGVEVPIYFYGHGNFPIHSSFERREPSKNPS